MRFILCANACVSLVANPLTSFMFVVEFLDTNLIGQSHVIFLT